jgi:hypothetical protein
MLQQQLHRILDCKECVTNHLNFWNFQNKIQKMKKLVADEEKLPVYFYHKSNGKNSTATFFVIFISCSLHISPIPHRLLTAPNLIFDIRRQQSVYEQHLSSDEIYLMW